MSFCLENASPTSQPFNLFNSRLIHGGQMLNGLAGPTVTNAAITGPLPITLAGRRKGGELCVSLKASTGSGKAISTHILVSKASQMATAHFKGGGGK